MNITKQNTTYVVNDTLDNGWKAEGSVSKDADNTLVISININNDEKNVGYYSYTYSNNVDMTVSALPQYFDAISTYAKTNADAISLYLNNLTSTDDVNSNSDTVTTDNN